MKKFMLIIGLVLLLPHIILSQKPMEKIMGVPWETNIIEAEKILKSRLNLVLNIKREDYASNDEYYRLIAKDIKFGFLNINKIEMHFYPQDNTIKRKSSNYKYYLLDNVTISIERFQFNNLFEVFKLKYGDKYTEEKSVMKNLHGAEFNQIYVYWIDRSLGRVISMIKYGKTERGEILKIPLIIFKKYNPDDFVTRSDIEETARMF